MAILVEISKMIEKNDIGYYKVSMSGSPSFYMGIDRNKKILKFYSSPNFTSPIKIVDCKNEQEVVGILPGFNSIAYSRALSRALTTFDMKAFPNFLNYEAWMINDKLYLWEIWTRRYAKNIGEWKSNKPDSSWAI